MEVLLSLLSILGGVPKMWANVRVYLPFLPKGKRVFWNLSANQERISQAIAETNSQHFEQELRSLYQRIEKFGLEIPLLEPVRTGRKEYDGTWYGFHLTFLKALRRQIRDEKFELEQWNSDVTRENNKRKNWLDV